MNGYWKWLWCKLKKISFLWRDGIMRYTLLLVLSLFGSVGVTIITCLIIGLSGFILGILCMFFSVSYVVYRESARVET